MSYVQVTGHRPNSLAELLVLLDESVEVTLDVLADDLVDVVLLGTRLEVVADALELIGDLAVILLRHRDTSNDQGTALFKLNSIIYIGGILGRIVGRKNNKLEAPSPA